MSNGIFAIFCFPTALLLIDGNSFRMSAVDAVLTSRPQII